MKIKVVDARIYIHNLRARLPFRYGIAEMTALPHLMLEVDLNVDGKLERGMAADSLVPKWFTKDPDTSYREDIAEMLDAVQHALDIAKHLEPTETVFDLWRAIYTGQQQWARNRAYPPLLWNFGVSLVERACIDAFCRAVGVPFVMALRANLFGIQLDVIIPELKGYSPADLLPSIPLDKVYLRHTVGMDDPIMEADIHPAQRLTDGYPQSLEGNIREYGLRYFKVKIKGDITADVERLAKICNLLQKLGISDYAFTLDGNEQFARADDFRRYWNALQNQSLCSDFLDHLLFVEQPLRRDVALSSEAAALMLAWEEKPPMIIDESDAEVESLRQAVKIGYAGTSHKNCKGVFKSIVNACYINFLCRKNGSKCYILSAEDLCNLPPIALMQDLAVAANLGIMHVERNGHHYFPGMSDFPVDVQNRVLEDYPSLFYRRGHGEAALKIQDGMLDLTQIHQYPFGVSTQLDLGVFLSLDQWDFESLEGLLADNLS